MSDAVELSFPIRSDLLVLARLTAATLAGRAEFGIEDIEDLRLVVEELCLSVIGGATSGTLHLRYVSDGDVVTIDCSLTGDGDADSGPASYREDGMSAQIIDALVDEHGLDVDEGRHRAWIRKRGSRVAG
jgi:anti-sigma regulatory factor (Ser/Thr protein kinase)